MAGAACKVVINNMKAALMAGLERVLLHPLVRGPMLAAEKCDVYLQQLADLDIACYNGDYSIAPEGGLQKIVAELEAAGVFTNEVWAILRPPAD